MAVIQEAENLFYIGDSPEEKLAFIEYEMDGDVLSILSTEVSHSLRGQGIAQQLVAYAVDYARRHHLKITPICPYAVKQFEIHAEYGDVKA